MYYVYNEYMNKQAKDAFVRIDPKVRDLARVRATVCRMTLKGWLERLIEAELKREPKEQGR